MTRLDLLDKGIYRAPEQPEPVAARSSPQLYEGGMMPPSEEFTLRIDQKGEHTEQETEAVAKRVEQGERVAYYIRFSTDGIDSGHILDPRGIYFRPEELNQARPRRGQQRYEFRRVPQQAFRDYLNYLVTHDTTHLRNAERQVLDA